MFLQTNISKVCITSAMKEDLSYGSVRGFLAQRKRLLLYDASDSETLRYQFYFTTIQHCIKRTWVTSVEDMKYSRGQNILNLIPKGNNRL